MSDALNVAAQWATIGAFLVAVVSLVVIAVQAWRYLDLRKREQRQKEFENYHELIRKLSIGGADVRLSAQKAIIFELSKYAAYGEVTVRILESLRVQWLENGHHLLVDETDLTITRLKDAQK